MLSDDLDEAMDLCSGCKARIELKKKAKQIDALIKNGIIIDLPSCIHGGQTQGDGKMMKIYCKNTKLSGSFGSYKSVNKFCKVMKNGANCDSLRWTRHSIKGKLPEPKK